MLMTSSSGCGLKTSTGPGLGAGGLGAERAHHLVENAASQALGRAVLAQEFVQLVLAEVVIR